MTRASNLYIDDMGALLLRNCGELKIAGRALSLVDRHTVEELRAMVLLAGGTWYHTTRDALSITVIGYGLRTCWISHPHALAQWLAQYEALREGLGHVVGAN